MTEQTRQQTHIQYDQELTHVLWIHICTYLEPTERIQLFLTSKELNKLSKQSSYNLVVPFYQSDLNYWMDNIEWMLCPIKTKRSRNLPLFALNFHQFDTMNIDLLLNIKYFIIFYDKICSIRINQNTEKAEHLLKLKMKQKIKWLDYQMMNITIMMNHCLAKYTTEREKEQELIEQELKQLNLTEEELENLTSFIPTTIIHIYMHELLNTDQDCVEYVTDCIRNCGKDCGIFRDFFDKSNLNNHSAYIL